jgi:cyclophilin family peptidyl-prolyl cis-trans isomerase
MTNRPKCWMDVSVDGKKAFHFKFELYNDICPITCENFRCLCTGEKGNGPTTGLPMHFKGTEFHRVISGFMAQGGDFARDHGQKSESIYGGRFADENFTVKHTKPGQLSMANAGPDTNGAQFFLTFVGCDWLDGKHCVFGECVEGLEMLGPLEKLGSSTGKTKAEVRIMDCGQC